MLIGYGNDLSNQCGIFFYEKNTAWINYFEDRMPKFYFRLHEIPVRERNYYNNQTEFNIVHNLIAGKYYPIFHICRNIYINLILAEVSLVI